MIIKKSGLFQVDSLCTIVLFQPDYNYAFKLIGREMMAHTERHKTLAPEQFGSRKNHWSIDQAVNKVLTYDNLQQSKNPGANCLMPDVIPLPRSYPARWMPSLEVVQNPL
jgi:hypothetical protein